MGQPIKFVMNYLVTNVSIHIFVLYTYWVVMLRKHGESPKFNEYLPVHVLMSQCQSQTDLSGRPKENYADFEQFRTHKQKVAI